MRLSTEQLERLSERVFQVLKASGHVAFDYEADDKVEEKVLESIMTSLEADTKTEERLARDAERLVTQQQQIARDSGKPMEQLISEVMERLAKSKKIVLGDGPERADNLAEKIFKSIWNIEGIDFFSDDRKIQNCIAHALYRFRHEDERILDAVENLVNHKISEPPFSPPWCLQFDRFMNELRQKLETTKLSQEPETTAFRAGV